VSAAHPLDLIIKRVRAVRPRRAAIDTVDLGVKDGRFARIAPDIPAADAAEVYDARGQLGFPGVVDAHTHVGIYGPLAEDAVTESRAAVSGGVTTMLTYFRTGQYYLNRGGAWADFFPEVLRQSTAGITAITPITWRHRRFAHREMEAARATACPRSRSSCSTAATACTVSRSGRAAPLPHDRLRGQSTISPTSSSSCASRPHPARASRAGAVRDVSLHCDLADILNAYTRLVAADPACTGLRAYSAARPPHSEGLAVWIAAYLAPRRKART
jgi:allantoinase